MTTGDSPEPPPTGLERFLKSYLELWKKGTIPMILAHVSAVIAIVTLLAINLPGAVTERRDRRATQTAQALQSTRQADLGRTVVDVYYYVASTPDLQSETTLFAVQGRTRQIFPSVYHQQALAAGADGSTAYLFFVFKSSGPNPVERLGIADFWEGQPQEARDLQDLFAEYPPERKAEIGAGLDLPVAGNDELLFLLVDAAPGISNLNPVLEPGRVVCVHFSYKPAGVPETATGAPYCLGGQPVGTGSGPFRGALPPPVMPSEILPEYSTAPFDP